MPTGTPTFVQDARGNVGNVAGQGQIYVNQSFPLIKNSYHQSITAESGGLRLESMEVGELLIGSVSGNHLMYIGGIDNDAPFSGRGLPLYAGPDNERRLPVLNANLVSVVSTFSGEMIYYMGFLNGQNTSLNPTVQGSQPNNAPPQLVSTTPQNGANNIFITSGNSFITFFNEDIASGTVDTSSYQIKLSGQTTFLSYISGAVSYYDPNNSGARAAIQIQPVSGQLQASSWYNVFIATTLTDDPGNALPASLTWSFLTAGVPDLVAPSGIAFVPASGSGNVAISTDLSVTFDEVISGNAGGSYPNIRLNNSGTPGTDVVGNTAMIILISGSGQISRLTFTPTTSLTAANWYQWAVSGVQDPYSNFMVPVSGIPFQTAVADVTAPVVSGTSPASGDTSVALAASINVTFSEQVSGSGGGLTISHGVISMILSGAVGGHASSLSGIITLDNTKKIMTFNPVADLLANKIYQVSVSGALDLASNIQTPKSGIVFTSISTDTTPPGVTAISPTINSSGVIITVTPTVTFSETISGTAGGAITGLASGVVTLRLSGSPTPIPASLALNAGANIITLTPSASLSGERWYQLSISGVMDLAGNIQTATVSGHGFKTEDTISPLIINTQPVSGSTNVIITEQPRCYFNETCSGADGATMPAVISLRKVSNNTFVTGTIKLIKTSTINNQFRFIPNGSLEYSTLYQLRFSGMIDLNGNFSVPVSGHSFTTESNPLTTVYDVVGGTEKSFGTESPVIVRAGEKRATTGSALNGRVIKRAAFALKRTGSPGGTVRVRIRGNTEGADSVAVLFDTSLSANSISTSKTRYAFEKLNNTYALTTNDAVMVEIDGASQNSSNYISVYYDGGNPYDGSDSHYTSYDNNYTDFTDRDIDAKFEI